MNARLEKLRSKANDGFTLVEMLIVVMILAILATLAALGVASYRTSANAAACETQKATIYTGAQAYLLTLNTPTIPGADPAAYLATLVTAGYLSDFPSPTDVTFTGLTDIEITNVGAIVGCA